jgi:hypothetical protein
MGSVNSREVRWRCESVQFVWIILESHVAVPPTLSELPGYNGMSWIICNVNTFRPQVESKDSPLHKDSWTWDKDIPDTSHLYRKYCCSRRYLTKLFKLLRSLASGTYEHDYAIGEVRGVGRKQNWTWILGDINNTEAWSPGMGVGRGATTLPCKKKKIVEKPARNSAGFWGGHQGLSWAVEPRKEEEFVANRPTSGIRMIGTKQKNDEHCRHYLHPRPKTH